MKRRRSEKFGIHKFYCLNCGKEGIPIPRKPSDFRSTNHRKKLYCPWCKLTLNFIEIKTEEEKIKFLEAFNNGAFKEEAALSIEEVNKNRLG